MTVEQRFKQYLDAKGIANMRAEKDCGLSNGTMKNGLNGSSFGSDKLVKILARYTDLSAEWLLRGTGTMIIGGTKANEMEQMIDRMSRGGRDRDAAYDIVIGMIDVIGKTYNFYSEK